MANQATTADRPSWQPEWLDLYPHIDTTLGAYAYVSNHRRHPRVTVGGGLSEKGLKGLEEAALMLHTAAELLENLVEEHEE